MNAKSKTAYAAGAHSVGFNDAFGVVQEQDADETPGILLLHFSRSDECP